MRIGTSVISVIGGRLVATFPNHQARRCAASQYKHLDRQPPNKSILMVWESPRAWRWEVSQDGHAYNRESQSFNDPFRAEERKAGDQRQSRLAFPSLPKMLGFHICMPREVVWDASRSYPNMTDTCALFHQEY
jgi:hypothetical protein